MARELNSLRERRQKEMENRIILIFKASGEVESFDQSHTRETPDFLITFRGYPKDKIRSQHEGAVNALLASIAIGCEHISGFEQVSDGVIFIDQENKPVYCYDAKVSARAMVTTRLKDNTLDFAAKYATKLAARKELVHASRLLAQSLRDENDGFSSFLATWAGLEIFVNGSFGRYEERTFEKLTNEEEPVAPLKFVQRIRGVMKGKYRLSDKFALLAFVLAPDSSGNDIEDFERIKRIRDNLMHGKDVTIGDLPTHDTRKLLRKYLRLYIEQMATEETA